MASGVRAVKNFRHVFKEFSRCQVSGPLFSKGRCISISSRLYVPIEVRMPALSPTMEEGVIVQWHKQEGQTVAPGDMLCEIRTDKAVVAQEVEEEGILAKILIGPDQTVKIGQLIAMIAEEGEDWQNIEIPSDSADTSVPRTPVASSDTASTTSSGRRIGPAVKSLLDVYKLSARDVEATGPHGALLKGDVLQHIKKHNLKPAPVTQVPTPALAKTTTPPVQQTTMPQTKTGTAPPPPAASRTAAPIDWDSEEPVDIPLTNMRKIIAKRLTESKISIPHAYASIQCNMGNVLQLRKDLIAEGTKVSVNDFIIKASAVALKSVPAVNAQWTGDSARLLGNIDVSVAVATESGLITPIVKDAIGLGVADISSTVKEMAGRAKENKLRPEEFQGGTFTISNLGMFGISEFTAVINPPQSCIMAVGSSRLVLDLEGHPQTMMTVTVSSDARVVDEFLATEFLEAFRDTLENPMLMLSHKGQKTQAADEDTDVDLQKLFAK